MYLLNCPSFRIGVDLHFTRHHHPSESHEPGLALLSQQDHSPSQDMHYHTSIDRVVPWAIPVGVSIIACHFSGGQHCPLDGIIVPSGCWDVCFLSVSGLLHTIYG